MVQKILDEPSDASQTAHLLYRYRAQKLSGLCGELPRGHTSQHTCRGTHNFDLPLKPGLMEVLLRFVVDLGVVNARLDPALALIIKLLRDTPRVLQEIRHQTAPSTCILKGRCLQRETDSTRYQSRSGGGRVCTWPCPARGLHGSTTWGGPYSGDFFDRAGS